MNQDAPHSSPIPNLAPGLLRRLASMFYEMLLLCGVLLFLVLAPQMVLAMLTHHLLAPRLAFAHLFLVLLAYFGWFWIHTGQTLAMKTWSLRLVTREGRQVPPLQALLRFLYAWPSLGLAGVGILWALVDREHLFLHDRLADTRIIQLPR